ncbi:MAG: recombinase family protein [Deltaproteobacteria bacterium]
MSKAPGTSVKAGAPTVRCAIYTRKSSEEGLDQEFNSLAAQREACEAYIHSQKSAGWIGLPERYDDGGLSGGTMERPALQRLLTDIAADRIDTVVVYKVDRLTRSLRDFAKIVDTFDANGVSFVSVTQQFNTTTSMGRLTLNMLLSFAQFEREVTGERIRDKIAASKRKGMWMGGLPSLGYDVKDRKLVVNAAEAQTVRHIFQRYVVHRSVHLLKHELDRDGIVSKARRDRNGNPTGTRPIAVGALYHILKNRLYRGEIVHRDRSYPGQHEAIIDQGLWDDVQAILAENQTERTTRSKATNPSLLAGLVFDSDGERMSPSHAVKNGVRYRYYVSQSLIKRGRSNVSDAACRVPAADLECLVADRFCAMLKDPSAILEFAGTPTIPTRKALIRRAAELATRWSVLSASDRRQIFQACIARIDVRTDTVEIAVRPPMLLRTIRGVPDGDRHTEPAAYCSAVLRIPARVRRTGLSTQMVIEGRSATARQPNRSLLRLIGQARHFQDLVISKDGCSFRELAARVGVSPTYFTRVFQLSFLAPDITTAILQGRQPPELSAIRLMRAGHIAPCWEKQRRQLGFDRQ